MRTQDAYQVTEVILQEITLTRPQDMLVSDGILYIADTGSGKVILYDLETKEVTEWGVGALTSPAGLFLTEDKQLYVADNAAGEVVLFNENGEVTRRYGRPTTVTFGSDATYRPSKVVANAGGTIYVVSEGSFDGMIQLDANGEFLGYFGYNNNPLTAWDYIAEYFFTDEMKAQLFEIVGRGATLLDAKGGWRGTDCSVVMCAVRGSEVAKLHRAVRAADKHAFVMLADASEIAGEGFRSANE